MTDIKKLSPKAVADRETGIILAMADVAGLPEQVFNALITDEVETWWGLPEVYLIRDWKADLRAGGTWTLNVLLPDGTALPASGEFIELAKPHKIVITRRYDWDYPVLGRRDTRVTYLIDPIDSGTRLTVRHEGFIGCNQAAYDHTEGWERYLEWLGAYLN
ncbi:SRPBCC family protein [Mucilaginibacter sp. McL0603]|uniref:SRPBCC family protein n=1 Tax=Mucilaginibacter sp. McL0603 TaxID=3415670 RepID=UPI003CF8DF2A